VLVVDRPADLVRHIGQKLGPTDWITVDQAMIQRFADATGDHQWIHVDVERAKRELPDGKTIAHGYLTMSLVPQMAYRLYDVRNKSRGLNYGSNKVRFTSAVPAGSRLRMHMTLKEVHLVAGGARIVSECTVELEGRERPALIAEIISMVFE
jgi:acyl dehydratase